MRTVDPLAHARVRGRILDAARTQFAGKGYHRASMNDVARAARLAKAAVYHYFPSKHALLEALHQEHWGETLGRLAQLPRPKSLREALTAAGRGYVEHFAKPEAAAMMRIALDVAIQDPELLAESMGLKEDAILSSVGAYFKPAFPRGSTDREVLLHISPFFGALFHYLFVMKCSCPVQQLPGDTETYLAHLIDVFAAHPRRPRGKK